MTETKVSETRVSETPEKLARVRALFSNKRLGSDGGYPGSVDLTAEIAALRLSRTPAELSRFQQLGKSCAKAMETAIRQVCPGLTEMEIAGFLPGSRIVYPSR